MQKRIAVAMLGAIGAPTGWAAASVVDISGPGTTLRDVLDGGGQFRVADKLFTVTDFFSVAFDASAIGISPLDFGLAGRGFRLSDAWADVPGDTTASDFTLSYMVEIVDDPDTTVDESNFRIVDNRLDFDGFATSDGSFARVDETVLDEFGNFLGEKSVFANGDGTSLFEDRIDFGLPGFSKLNIVKDAQFFVPLGTGTAGASFIDQTFSQIPAPGPLAVVLAGLGVATRRRR
ncbi:MAG: hypothetical protein AAF297_00155 [Planctomycetota bacterium]